MALQKNKSWRVFREDADILNLLPHFNIILIPDHKRTSLSHLRTEWIPVGALESLVLEPPAVQGDEDLTQEGFPFEGP